MVAGRPRREDPASDSGSPVVTGIVVTSESEGLKRAPGGAGSRMAHIATIVPVETRDSVPGT